MLRFITILFILGIIVRFVSKYISPILNVNAANNDRIRQMQQQMQEMDRKVNENKQKQKPQRVEKDGDYIEYEEVK